MKYLYINPIRGNTSFFALFSSKLELESFDILNNDDSRIQEFKEANYKILCFDTFKVMGAFKYEFFPCDDVQTLYQLQGYQFRNLIDLGNQTLGQNRMEKYISISDKVNVHIDSYRVAKIDVNQFGTNELIPRNLLEDLFKERALIVTQLYKNIKNNDVKKFYNDRFIKVLKSLDGISRDPIKINLDTARASKSHHLKAILEKVKHEHLYLTYNPVGAKTGRLSFNKNSPNIYGIPKKLRSCIVPEDGFKIAQFDFKAFQPRLAIFSTDNKQFKKKFKDIDDIYSVFPGDRQENKIAFLAWMYSPYPKNDVFENEAGPILTLRRKLYKKSRKNSVLVNTFGRPIYYTWEPQHTVFQNYITSLEVDVILSIMTTLHTVLRKKRSRIMFPFHDALFFEIHEKEMDLLRVFQNYMESFLQKTFDARFPVEVKIGNNLGELK